MRAGGRIGHPLRLFVSAPSLLACSPRLSAPSLLTHITSPALHMSLIAFLHCLLCPSHCSPHPYPHPRSHHGPGVAVARACRCREPGRQGPQAGACHGEGTEEVRVGWVLLTGHGEGTEEVRVGQVIALLTGLEWLSILTTTTHLEPPSTTLTTTHPSPPSAMRILSLCHRGRQRP